jgi:hypothetical protein
MPSMSPGRLGWTAIEASAFVAWLAVGSTLLWPWMDFHLASFIGGGLSLVPVCLRRLGVRRRLLGDDGEAAEQSASASPPAGPTARR